MKSTYNPITFDNATDLRHFIIDTVKEELDKKDYSPVNLQDLQKLIKGIGLMYMLRKM